jgi:hypothetical protein
MHLLEVFRHVQMNCRVAGGDTVLMRFGTMVVVVRCLGCSSSTANEMSTRNCSALARVLRRSILTLQFAMRERGIAELGLTALVVSAGGIRYVRRGSGSKQDVATHSPSGLSCDKQMFVGICCVAVALQCC